MNIKKIEDILGQLMSQSSEIQGVVLISSDGQPLIKPIGMDDNSVMIMAGIFLYLAQTTCQEFDGQEIESITVRGQDGHVIFTCCYQDIFLLVKASKNIFSGFLEREINLTGKKLQAELQGSETAAFKSQSSFNSTSTEFSNLDRAYSSKLESNEKLIKNNGIRYRGLPSMK